MRVRPRCKNSKEKFATKINGIDIKSLIVGDRRIEHCKSRLFFTLTWLPRQKRRKGEGPKPEGILERVQLRALIPDEKSGWKISEYVSKHHVLAL